MRIYVIFPYGRRHGLPDKECELNVLESLEITRELIRMGHNPFCPLLWHYVHLGWRDSPDEEKYYELVSEWLPLCHTVLVTKIPPWEGGVQREIELAHKHRMIPIRSCPFTDPKSYDPAHIASLNKNWK